MKTDFIELKKAIDGLVEAFKKMFPSMFNRPRDLINNMIERLKIIIYKEKFKFKPVLKIESTGLYYRDNSLENYYCRNNC